MYLNKWTLWVSMMLILASCGLLPDDQISTLVSVDQIARKMERGEKVQLIDVRTQEEYLHSHIKGARNIWRDDMIDYQSEVEGMAMKKEDLAELLSYLGISHEDSIYLYDSRGNVDAARLWWMLRMYGFDEVALIDGGFIQWRMRGHETVEGPERFKPATFVFLQETRPDLVTSKAAVSGGQFEQIIDARSLEEYTGEVTKNGAFRGGHIPGAVRFDYIDMMDGGSFKFKSREQVRGMLRAKGLSEEKSTVTYCHSGVRSAMALFVLTQIVGMEQVSNFDGSWIEWSEDESLPVEK